MSQAKAIVIDASTRGTKGSADGVLREGGCRVRAAERLGMFGCSRHSAGKYLPRSDQRERWALCLGGVGLRALLFQYGALLRLDELGALSRMDILASVGGGAILAGAWSLLDSSIEIRPGERIPELRDRWHRAILRIAKLGVRPEPSMFTLLRSSGWWRGKRPNSTDRRALVLDDRLYREVTLEKLPAKPTLVFSGVDVRTGGRWEFTRARWGEPFLGFADSKGVRLADVVAGAITGPLDGSPKVFQLKLGALEKAIWGPEADSMRTSIPISDACVLDPLGVESVWRRCRTLLVIDGGVPKTIAPNFEDWLGDRLLQASRLSLNACRQRQKHWLMSHFIGGSLEGAYLGVDTYHAHYGLAGSIGYPEQVVERLIEMPANLEPMPMALIMTLANHGYTLADVALRRYCPEMVSLSTPLDLPFPDWVDRVKVLGGLSSTSAPTARAA